MTPIQTTSPPACDTPIVNMEAHYPPCVELEALTLTAEYCAVHSITDPLRVRQVHYLALSIVLEEQ